MHDVGDEVEQEAPVERHTLHHRLPRGNRTAEQRKAGVRQSISHRGRERMRGSEVITAGGLYILS